MWKGRVLLSNRIKRAPFREACVKSGSGLELACNGFGLHLGKKDRAFRVSIPVVWIGGIPQEGCVRMKHQPCDISCAPVRRKEGVESMQISRRLRHRRSLAPLDI